MNNTKEPSHSPFFIKRRQFLKLLALAGTAAACSPRNLLSTSDASPSATPPPVPPFIIDGHEDIAWNAVEFGRDALLSALEVRQQEAGQPIEDLIGQRTTGLPQWREGRIAIIFSTIFVMPAGHSYTDYQQAVYSTLQEANEAGWKELRYYQDLASRESSITIIKNRSDLDTVIDSWVNPAPGVQSRTGLVMLMEGADPIIEPEDVHEWYENGLRIIGPAWRSTHYAAGTGSYGGSFSQDGKKLLTEMAGLNMILDLSHLSHPAILDALDLYTGPLIASHSNPLQFLPTDRGLTDAMIKRIEQHNGVVGIIPYNCFLKPGWESGMPRSEVTIETVADAIDYVTQLLGNADHVALGSDFDGGFGLDSIPEGMDTVADLSKIATALQNRGYSEEDIHAVMSGNWQRILEEGLPAA